MKKLKTVITPILFVLLTIMASCSMYDETEDLSGGYFYYDEAPDSKILVGSGPTQENVGSIVETYAYDDNYIIAIQRPLLEYYRSAIEGDLTRCAPSINTKEAKIKADSILKHDPYYQNMLSRPLNYWIISHKADSLFGPFSKEEYLQKRKELGVPDNLQFDIENGKF